MLLLKQQFQNQSWDWKSTLDVLTKCLLFAYEVLSFVMWSWSFTCNCKILFEKQWSHLDLWETIWKIFTLITLFPIPLNRDLKKPLRPPKSLLQLQMTSLLPLLSKNGSAVPIMQVLLLLFQPNVIITYYIAQLSRKREMVFSVAKKICWNPSWTRNVPYGPVPKIW